jgi:outer membrane lipoprotein SlyB
MTNASAAQSPRMHPMMWIAAGSVTLFSLTGIAALSGVLPASKLEAASNAEISAISQSAPAPVAPVASIESAAPQVTPVSETTPAAAPKASPKPLPKPAAKPPVKPSKVAAPKSDPHLQVSDASHTQSAIPTRVPDDRPRAVAVASCYDCGIVESIRAVEHTGEGSGLGAVGGAVLGGVLGHQVGEGQGKQIARIGGAILGGIAGHQAEKQIRKTSEYEVTVRMEDGSRKTITQPTAPVWNEGDRVRVANGAIVGRSESSSPTLL